MGRRLRPGATGPDHGGGINHGDATVPAAIAGGGGRRIVSLRRLDASITIDRAHRETRNSPLVVLPLPGLFMANMSLAIMAGPGLGGGDRHEWGWRSRWARDRRRNAPPREPCGTTPLVGLREDLGRVSSRVSWHPSETYRTWIPECDDIACKRLPDVPCTAYMKPFRKAAGVRLWKVLAVTVGGGGSARLRGLYRTHPPRCFAGRGSRLLGGEGKAGIAHETTNES